MSLTPGLGKRGRFAKVSIVEFNTMRDPSEVTAMVTVKLLKEIAAKILR